MSIVLQVSQPQSQVETEERADTQPTPVTHTATPGSARPSQAAAKLLEEFTCKTLGLADPSAQTQTQTQMLLWVSFVEQTLFSIWSNQHCFALFYKDEHFYIIIFFRERLEALESKQEMVLGGLKESIAQHFSDLKTTFSQALQHFKDDVIQHLNTHSRPQHNEASAQEEDECSTHSIHKKADAEDAGGCPGSSCTGTAQAQAQGPVPSAGDGNPKPPSSSSMLSIRSSFKSCISSRNADVYEQSETLNLEGGVARSSSTETEIICILEDEEQESGASEDLPYNFLRHRRPRSGTRSVFLTDDR